MEEEQPAARETGTEQGSWVKGRWILTPTNISVDKVNHFMITKWPGKEQELLSADIADEEKDSGSYSVKYLGSLNPTGLPAHWLIVKPSIPMMLLRNLEPSAGLCNGTRLIFKRMQGYVMVCHIMYIDVKVLIPRISLKPKDRIVLLQVVQEAVPLRVAFACTVSLQDQSGQFLIISLQVNKSQGDSLKYVAIWLPKPVFANGQAYMAPSLVGSVNQCHYAFRPVENHYN